jgi:hypothetical protein
MDPRITTAPADSDDSLITFESDPALLDGCGVLELATGHKVWRFGLTAGQFCQWALDMGLKQGQVTRMTLCPALHDRMEQTMAALGIKPVSIH